MPRLCRLIAVALLVLTGTLAADRGASTPAARDERPPALTRTEARPQGPPAGPLRDFAAELDVLAASLIDEVGVRGIAVAIIEDGTVALERTYGYADVSRQIPVDTDTMFNAASVTKPVTAWGVLRLADEGRIDLDAPVFSKVSRWKLPPSAWSADGVTPRRLLSHTAGLTRWTVAMWEPDDKLPTLEAALSGDSNGYGDTTLQSEPGTQFSYSGGGYSILQLLIEESTGLSIIDYMRDRVLAPLGMTQSEYGWTRPRPREATPYSEFGNPIHAVRLVELGAGGLQVTIRDLGKFAAAHVASGDAPAGRGVLSPARLAEALSPAANTDGARGLGPAISKTAAGRVLIGHDGGNPGWGAVYQVDPRTRDGIAILVNRSWGYQAYTPILCAWRNWSREGGAPETCTLDQSAVLLHTIVKRGLEAGRRRFDDVHAATPAALSDRAMRRLAQQFMNERHSEEALEVLKWNVSAWPSSSPAHESLGDVLLARGDAAAARASFTEAVRLDPKNSTAPGKLAKLPAAR